MRTLIAVSLLMLVPAVAHATTRKVPSSYPTIQAAINACVDGDMVLVAPGTYNEKIDFLGKDITVTSSGGAAVTTIHASTSGSVVTFKNAETAAAILSGFTITGGTGTVPSGTDSFGGGVYCSGASPTITANVIIDNTARGSILFNPGGSGGGIYVSSGSPAISSNTITSNEAEDDGAGICCVNNSHPSINGNSITQNFCYSGKGGGISASASLSITSNTIAQNYGSAAGGGIYCAASATISFNTIDSNSSLVKGGGIQCGAATVTRNTITNNQANGFAPGSGGGIECSGAAVLQANTVANNKACFGAGIHCASGSAALTSNMVVDNSAVYGGVPGIGGGIHCSSASPTITNVTIARNSAPSGGSAGGVAASSTTSITNCISWDNTATSNPEITGNPVVTFSDVEGGFAGNGNINADPMFANAPSGDYHILPVSPCLNKGSNAAPLLPAIDFEGDARIHYDIVDMGADEMAGCLVAFARFGQGLAGSGGLVPLLYGTDGSCDAGGHVVHIASGIGGAKGNLWVGVTQGDVPFYGGHFYIGLGAPWVAIPIKLNGAAGVPGAGFLDIPGANVNAYAGLVVYMQVSLLDAGAVHGVSLTNGSQVTIGE